MGWQDDLPQELTVTSNGQSIPLREHSLIKETPDVPTLAKRFYDTHQSMHSRVPLPNGESKPEDWAKWETEVNDKLKGHGYLVTKPDRLRPTAPEKYEFSRPDWLPEDAWSAELEQGAAQIFKEGNIDEKTAAKLSEWYFNSLAKAYGPIERDVKAAETDFMNMAKAAGKDPVKITETAKRVMDEKFKSPRLREKLLKSGLADDYDFLAFVHETGEAMGLNDIRNDAGSGPGDGDGSSYEDIIKARTDPNHPDHYKAISDDPAWLAKRDAAYKKKFGTKEV